jgi:hypothetical protein
MLKPKLWISEMIYQSVPGGRGEEGDGKFEKDYKQNPR